MKIQNNGINIFCEMLSKKKIKAFTLVELIIVITILAILATTAFLSFQWYSKNARDSNRITTQTQLQKWIEVFQVTTWTLPNPEWVSIEWTFNSKIIAKSWVIWDNISKIIKIDKTPTDPLWDKKYAYWVSIDGKYFQIATVLEWWVTAMNSIISTTYADAWYNAKVLWNYDWILVYDWSIYNLPSLIFTSSWDLLSNEVNFVVDKWPNLPYAVWNIKNIKEISTSEVVKIVTKNKANSLTWINILGKDLTSYYSLSWSLSNDLWYDSDLIWKKIFWEKFITFTPTTCTNFTYSTWTCQPNSTAPLTILTSSPNWCVWWTPQTTTSCTYVEPTVWTNMSTVPGQSALYAWVYTTWNNKILRVAWTETTWLAWKTTNSDDLWTFSATDWSLNTQVFDSNHPAWKYCQDLVWAWYSDWYLPAMANNSAWSITNCWSKPWELQFLYCQHKWTWSQALLWFNSPTDYDIYWSSNESTWNPMSAIYLTFYNGNWNWDWKTKTTNAYIRCVRKAN